MEKYVTLNNGVKMPRLGFGVYQINNLAQTQQVVEDGLEVGYRLVDTAQIYGNEQAVGDAIKHSNVPREDIFVTSKVWVDDYGYDATLKAFDETMKKLQLDYLDLYLIHKPYNDYYGTWRAMERLYKEGRIRAIGVSSFWNERLADLITFNNVKPAVNQIETNVWNQEWKSQAYMEKEGVQPEAWAPFAEGAEHIFTNPVLAEIAQKHGKTTAQVMIRWFLQRNYVVIPKSVHKARLAENFDVFDFEIDAEDMAKIKTLDQGHSVLEDEMDPEIAESFR
ncbi:aldo/keto reductase [Lactobacillus gallinarum]|uniref:aldo/keto reductase n=1 Tax=Lactobacillus gallinarum TaxID=52242 RepID=UPI0024B1CCEA|nr:aldo/keto reductase [Lactobacillus gallinarum]